MNNRFEIENAEVFYAGDEVRCLRRALFLYGEPHIKDKLYVITSEDLAYYRENKKDYELVNRRAKPCVLTSLAINAIEEQLSVLRNKVDRVIHNLEIKTKIKALEFAIKKLQGN